MNSCVSLFLVVVAAVVALAAEAREAEYFLVRRDVRRCAFPRCGGFFLKPLNVETFDCPRGERVRRGECYVVDIQGITVTPELSLVRGKFEVFNDGLNSFAATEGYEGKIAQGTVKEQDIYYSTRDMGIVCIAAPCNSFHSTKLNEGSYQRDTLTFAEITGDDGREKELTALFEALRRDDVLLAATAYPVRGPAGNSLGLKIANYYLKLQEPAKPCIRVKDCLKGSFCAKESCTATSGFCQVRPSTCEKQSAPVCSCDGAREFENDCIRQLFGFTAATDGRCNVAEQ
jgi:hypothetical protein